MDRSLPTIYPITDRRLSRLSHADQVRRLIEAGATLVQLREKDLAAGVWIEDALECARLCREHGVKLIVNDRVDVALVIGADGVHLGQTDLYPAAARRLLGPTAIIGYSTHTLEQVKAALSEPVNYLAFGPIFATATKDRPDPTVGLGMLKKAVELARPMPLVAIGGITERDLSAVGAIGVASAALISTLLSSPDHIESNYRRCTITFNNR